MLRLAINQYTSDGRAAIHKRLEGINTRVLSYLMRNPIQDKSVEYNDNRLSLYCGQGGKCAITGQYLEIGLMHCHHIVPLCKGGTDEYANLVFVSDMVHRLIHATTNETIEELLYQRNCLSNFRQSRFYAELVQLFHLLIVKF